VSWDVIVVGLGGMGSATAYHLAQRGQRVLGLEAREPVHDKGSSHGDSRLIRKVYKEGARYVPLLLRAYELWSDLERRSGKRLLTTTGGILVTTPGGESWEGMRQSAETFGLALEAPSAEEIGRRWPDLRVPDGLSVLYEPDAGVLAPEECVRAHLDLATAHGADLRFDEPVLRWRADGEGVEVETDGEIHRASRLVLTPGPWAGRVLADMRLPLRVVRVVNAHFECAAPSLGFEVFPTFIFETEDGNHYGVPAFPGQGVKIGRHDANRPCDPDTIRRDVDDREVEALRAVLARYLPAAAGQVMRTLTCMYTNTPDEDFVIDRHPEHPQVSVGVGFSGHGFKFSSVVGEVLADLATKGCADHEIGFLSASRPALR
jgi:sarcosine oxidase